MPKKELPFSFEDIVQGKIFNSYGGEPPEKKKKKGSGGEKKLKIKGGITAGRVVPGDQFKRDGEVVSETPAQTEEGYPVGTLFLPYKIKGGINDQENSWDLFRGDDGKPVKQGDNFVYVPRKKD